MERKQEVGVVDPNCHQHSSLFWHCLGDCVVSGPGEKFLFLSLRFDGGTENEAFFENHCFWTVWPVYIYTGGMHHLSISESSWLCIPDIPQGKMTLPFPIWSSECRCLWSSNLEHPLQLVPQHLGEHSPLFLRRCVLSNHISKLPILECPMLRCIPRSF